MRKLIRLLLIACLCMVVYAEILVVKPRDIGVTRHSTRASAVFLPDHFEYFPALYGRGYEFRFIDPDGSLAEFHSTVIIHLLPQERGGAVVDTGDAENTRRMDICYLYVCATYKTKHTAYDYLGANNE